MRLAVVYDTSYLMSGRPLIGVAAESHPLAPQTCFGPPDWPACPVTNVVAKEVQEEIGKHLRSQDTEAHQRASLARGQVLKLMERKCDSFRFEEPSLAASGAPRIERGPLDLDSETDALLLGHGLELLCSGAVTAVVLASNDGGIHFTFERVRGQSTEPLAMVCLRDLSERERYAPLVPFLTTVRLSIQQIVADGRGLAIFAHLAASGYRGQALTLRTDILLPNGDHVPWIHGPTQNLCPDADTISLANHRAYASFDERQMPVGTGQVYNLRVRMTCYLGKACRLPLATSEFTLNLTLDPLPAAPPPSLAPPRPAGPPKPPPRRPYIEG